MRGSSGGFKSFKRQGGWINLAIAVIGAVASSRAASAAGDRAERDSGRSEAIEAGHLQIAQNQDRRGGELFQHYRTKYMPRESELVYDTFENELSADAEEARATADVRESFATGRRSDLQRERSMGLNPNSGASSSLAAARSLEESKIEGGMRARARSNVDDVNFGRKMAVLSMGSPTAATAYSGQALAGSGQAASLAAARSRDSNDLAYSAGAGAGAAMGEFADAGLEAWRNRGTKTQKAA